MTQSVDGDTKTVGCTGCTLGSFVAVCLSIKTWGLTWWVLLHALCGWFYVGYWVIFNSGWVK